MASSTNLLKDITEEGWAKLKDGIYSFGLIGLDGRRTSISLNLWGGRGRVRHADFYIRDDWHIAPKANQQLYESYMHYWRGHWSQRPKKVLRTPGTPGQKRSVRLDFLCEDSGIWLYRAAQFLSDPHNLYDRIFDGDPVRQFELAYRAASK